MVPQLFCTPAKMYYICAIFYIKITFPSCNEVKKVVKSFVIFLRQTSFGVTEKALGQIIKETTKNVINLI